VPGRLGRCASRMRTRRFTSSAPAPVHTLSVVTSAHAHLANVRNEGRLKNATLFLRISSGFLRKLRGSWEIRRPAGFYARLCKVHTLMGSSADVGLKKRGLDERIAAWERQHMIAVSAVGCEAVRQRRRGTGGVGGQRDGGTGGAVTCGWVDSADSATATSAAGRWGSAAIPARSHLCRRGSRREPAPRSTSPSSRAYFRCPTHQWQGGGHPSTWSSSAAVFRRRSMPAALALHYTRGTYLWGYKINGGARAFQPSPSNEAQPRARRTTVTYNHSLANAHGAPLVLHESW